MQKRLLAFFMISLSGCGAFVRPAPGPGESLLIGFDLPCYGFVRPVGNDGSAATYALVRSGPTTIKINAESEPDFSNAAFANDTYQCSLRTTHTLQFDAKEGKSYRLHLEQQDPESFFITVWEGLDEKTIKTAKVASNSKQLSLDRRCYHYGPCEQWPSK